MFIYMVAHNFNKFLDLHFSKISAQVVSCLQVRPMDSSIGNTKVLENNLLRFAKVKCGANYVFQQNNTSIHDHKLAIIPFHVKHEGFEFAN